jgi:hypothetical protein
LRSVLGSSVRPTHAARRRESAIDAARSAQISALVAVIDDFEEMLRDAAN